MPLVYRSSGDGPLALKIAIALFCTAAFFFLLGMNFGIASVPRAEQFYQELIDGCHRFLEAGLPADFGRCIAGQPANSN